MATRAGSGGGAGGPASGGEASGAGRRRLVILAAALVALTGLGYARGLGNGFVWDDQHVIVKGRVIGELGKLPQLFLHNAMWNSDGGTSAGEGRMDTYRPLTLATFALERAIWGLWPAGYHLGSVFVHAGNVLLIFWLGLRLGRPAGTAFLAAALFGVHPAISEAVFWINGRSDPLMLAFSLAAVLAATGPRGRPVVVGLFVLAATLCKETAFLLVPVLALGLVAVGPRARLATALPFIAGLSVGFVARLLALSRPALTSHPDHLGHALVRVPLIWWDALVGILAPTAALRPSLHERYRTVSAEPVLLSLAAMAALLGAGLWLWHRERQRQAPSHDRAARVSGSPGSPHDRAIGNGRLIVTGLVAFAVVMAPVALLTFDEGWSGWGRYLYAACPILLLGLASAIEDALRPRLTDRVRRIYRFAWGVVIVLGVTQLWLAAPAWKNDVALGIAQIEDDPQSSAGYAWTAQHFLESQQPELALPLLQKAVALAPDNPIYRARLALALAQLERHAEARAHARAALDRDPESHVAVYVLGLAALAEGDETLAARYLMEAVAARPTLSGLWQSLRDAYASRGPSSAFHAEVERLANNPRYTGIAARLSR